MARFVLPGELKAKRAKEIMACSKQALVRPVNSGLTPAWRVFLSHERQYLAAELLSGDFELCGPSVVLRRYLSLVATCKELQALVLGEALPQLVPRLPPTLWREHRLGRWLKDRPLVRRVLRGPIWCKLDELKAAARIWGLKLGGPKHEVTMRLLEYAGLARPSLVPADLVLAVKQEKLEYLSQSNRALANNLKRAVASNLARVRNFLHANRVSYPSCLTVYRARRFISEALGVADEAGWRRLLMDSAAPGVSDLHGLEDWERWPGLYRGC